LAKGAQTHVLRTFFLFSGSIVFCRRFLNSAPRNIAVVAGIKKQTPLMQTTFPFFAPHHGDERRPTGPPPRRRRVATVSTELT
jgi:hypothetical protein